MTLQNNEVALSKRRTGVKGWFNLVAVYIAALVGAASRPEMQRQSRIKKTLGYPIRAIIGPLVVSKSNRWQVGFRLSLVENVESMTSNQRLNLVRQLHQLHAAEGLLKRPGRLYGLSLPFDPESCEAAWQQQVITNPTPEILKRNRQARNFQKAKLREANLRDLQLFMVLNLKNWRSFLLIAGIKLQILFLRRDPRILYKNAAEGFAEQVEGLLEIIQQHGFENARPMTQREMYWLIEKTVFPGHDVVPDPAIPADEPLSDLVYMKLMTDNYGYDHGKCLELERSGDDTPNSSGSRFTSYLALSKLPEQLTYDWLFSGHRNGHPVEFAVNFVSTPAQVSENKATRYNQRLGETWRLLRKNPNTSTDLGRVTAQRAISQEILEYSQAGGIILQLHIFVIMSHDSKRELQTLRTKYETKMRKRGMIFDTDVANQEEIRESLFLGNTRNYLYHHIDLRTMALAKSLYCADTGGGNGGAFHGFVVGRRIKPFLFSLSRVLLQEVDEAGLMVVCGPSGSGKTTWMTGAAVADAADGACVVFDEGAVKQDTIEIKELNGVPVLHLDFTKYDGALNPGMIGQTLEEKRDMITDFFQQCCKVWDPLRYNAPLQAAVRELLSVDPTSDAFRRPDLMSAVTKLVEGEYGPDGVQLGAQIMALAQHRRGKLFFSTTSSWDEISRFMQPGVLTFIHYGEQQIPEKLDKDRTRWTDSDHLAVLTRRYAKHLFGVVANLRDIYVHLMFDEIHHDKKLGDDNYAEDYGRVSRSKQTVVTLGSQAPEDFREQFYQYVAAVLMFTQKYDHSAAACLPGLNIQAKPGTTEFDYWIDRLTNGLGKYHAYFRWLKGNPVMVKLQDHWTGDDFRTNNRARYAIQQRQVAELTRRIENSIRRQPTPTAAEAELRRIGWWPADRASQQQRVELVLKLRDDQIIERTSLGISLNLLLDRPPQPEAARTSAEPSLAGQRS